MSRCHIFDFEDAEEAGAEERSCTEFVKDYGDECNGNPLYVWDDGWRQLYRCKKCGKLILVQKSVYMDMCGDYDSYYYDYFPVESEEEAEEMNRKWCGFEIERDFPGKYLMRTNGNPYFANRELG